VADAFATITRLKTDAAAREDARVRVERTADGPVALARNETGAWVPIHSRRNPQLEADRWLQPALIDPRPSALIIIGSGLGFVLDSAERLASETRIVAIEPVPALLPALLARRDWRDALEGGRLTICAGPDYQGASEAWRLLQDDPRSVRVLAHPVIARLFPEETAAARKVAERILFDARANDDARREHAGRYLINTLTNLPVIGREGDAAALADCLPGVPAVIAAAGPSLDRNLVDLAAVRDRVILIAVDTALRPLLAAGLAPDLVVSVDPSPLNARHLRDLPPCPDAWLAAEASLDPTVFPRFSGRTFTFKLADHHPWPWLATLGVTRPIVRTWGSVLTSAFDLAITIGCDPIAFVGADLAYTNGRPYCRRTTYEADWAAQTASGAALPDLWRSDLESRTRIQERDIRGAWTTTAPHLRAFRDWLVEQIAARGDRRFVNATGAGILHGAGLQQFTLREALGSVRRDATTTARQALSRAHSRGERPTALARAVDRLIEATAGATPPVFETWRQFAAGTIEQADITKALATASVRFQASQPPDPPLTDAAAERSPLPQAETAAILRTVLMGEPLPAWLNDTLTSDVLAPDDSAGGSQPLDEAVRRLLYDGTAATAGDGPVALDDICSSAFAWDPARGADLALLEGWLAWHVWSHRRDYAPKPNSAWAEGLPEPALDARRPQPDEPIDAAASSGAPRARLALLRQVLVAMESVPGASPIAGQEAPFWAGAGLLSTAIQVSPLRSTAAHVSCTIRAQTGLSPLEASSPAALDLQIPLWSLMRRTTGSLANWVSADTGGPAQAAAPPPVIHRVHRLAHHLECELAVTFERADDDPRIPFFLSIGGRQPFRLLTDEGLPACYFAATLGPHHAVVSSPEGGSYTVDEWGEFRPRPAWPRPIVNELPWGDDGGALAWHSSGTGSYAMLRPSAEAEPILETMPFRAFRLLEEPDGVPLWASLEGGVWKWLPGKGARRLVESPPLLAVHRDGPGLRLDPRPPGPVNAFPRTLLETAWRWVPGAKRLSRVRMTSAGQCAFTAPHGPWTAHVHPYSDLLRFAHADGGHVDLACCYPVAAGWAGTSLVVATGDGAVLLLPRMVSALEAERQRGSRREACPPGQGTTLALS